MGKTYWAVVDKNGRIMRSAWLNPAVYKTRRDARCMCSTTRCERVIKVRITPVEESK